MKTLILTIPFALSVFCAFAQKQVYVCTGTGAYRYHYYKDCSGQIGRASCRERV